MNEKRKSVGYANVEDDESSSGTSKKSGKRKSVGSLETNSGSRLSNLFWSPNKSKRKSAGSMETSSLQSVISLSGTPSTKAESGESSSSEEAQERKFSPPTTRLRSSTDQVFVSVKSSNSSPVISAASGPHHISPTFSRKGSSSIQPCGRVSSNVYIPSSPPMACSPNAARKKGSNMYESVSREDSLPSMDESLGSIESAVNIPPYNLSQSKRIKILNTSNGPISIYDKSASTMTLSGILTSNQCEIIQPQENRGNDKSFEKFNQNYKNLRKSMDHIPVPTKSCNQGKLTLLQIVRNEKPNNDSFFSDMDQTNNVGLNSFGASCTVNSIKTPTREDENQKLPNVREFSSTGTKSGLPRTDETPAFASGADAIKMGSNSHQISPPRPSLSDESNGALKHERDSVEADVESMEASYNYIMSKRYKENQANNPGNNQNVEVRPDFKNVLRRRADTERKIEMLTTTLSYKKTLIRNEEKDISRKRSITDCNSSEYKNSIQRAIREMSISSSSSSSSIEEIDEETPRRRPGSFCLVTPREKMANNNNGEDTPRKWSPRRYPNRKFDDSIVMGVMQETPRTTDEGVFPRPLPDLPHASLHSLPTSFLSFVKHQDRLVEVENCRVAIAGGDRVMATGLWLVRCGFQVTFCSSNQERVEAINNNRLDLLAECRKDARLNAFCNILMKEIEQDIARGVMYGSLDSENVMKFSDVIVFLVDDEVNNDSVYHFQSMCKSLLDGTLIIFETTSTAGRALCEKFLIPQISRLTGLDTKDDLFICICPNLDDPMDIAIGDRVFAKTKSMYSIDNINLPIFLAKTIYRYGHRSEDNK